jgi:stearoyl-CoA desaturase (delta-9 desaturase)
MTVTTTMPVSVPEPVEDPSAPKGFVTQRLVTVILVGAPVLALGAGLPFLWGHVLRWPDVILAVTLYVMTGHGITVGFHRLFSHHSFKANRAVKIGLAVLGSMAVEGSVTSWVATHRRHHMFSDRPGDPHSPWWPHTGSGPRRLLGLAHAHFGWLFGTDSTSVVRYAPDMVADRDINLIGRLFPLFAAASFALPFGLGWAWSGTLAGALTAFLWAGVIRIALLHHVTWGVNSLGHLFGRRPFATGDRSTNFAPLAVVSFGDSWHNFHHACPSSARHGVQPHQVDSSAALIRLMEYVGWATKVRWPSAERVAGCLTAGSCSHDEG